MLVQIYEIQTPWEAEHLIALGVDHLGSVITDRENWRDPAVREAVRLSAGTASRSSVIPLFNDLETVLRLLDYYRPDIVHFCENLPLRAEAGDRRGAATERLVALQGAVRERFPKVRITRSLPVPGAAAATTTVPGRARVPAAAPGVDGSAPEGMGPARRGDGRGDDDARPPDRVPDDGRPPGPRGGTTGLARTVPDLSGPAGPLRAGLAALLDSFAPVTDFFMTDTLLTGPGGVEGDAIQPVAGFVGITGATCDWEIAAWLVRVSPRPVILAGGLGPENVAAAIGRVRPAGVDSCTRTNALDASGRPIRFQKDIDKVRRFVAAARRAATATA
ncbi:MAG: hypothetical protein QM278_11780 [Pseudomonadota bacterium]|nr:hypothetical protein [Pseudomonadota bacterium]